MEALCVAIPIGFFAVPMGVIPTPSVLRDARMIGTTTINDVAWADETEARHLLPHARHTCPSGEIGGVRKLAEHPRSQELGVSG